MVNFKTILTLHYEGVSMRQISSRLLCSRNTVSSVIKSAELNKLTSAEVNSLSEEEVSKRLFPEKEVVPAYVQPDFEHIHKELLKPGTTLSILYGEYVMQCKSQHKPFYKRSYFFERYKEYVKKNRLTMHINHKPGDRVMVDWDGTTMNITDPYTGEITTAYLFVATLPFSMLCYVQACTTMKIPDWIDCHINMFEYFDGVPRLLVPDNLKTGVITNKKYEDPFLNKTYQEMADY